MKTTSPHRTSAAVALALLLATLPSTRMAAALLTYEGFDYTAAETLSGKSGGTGWGLNWSSDGSNPTNGIIAAASLSNTSSLATAGQSITFGNGTIYTRQFANTLGTLGSTVWVSLLYSGGTSATPNESRIGFYSGLTDGSPTDNNTNTAGATLVVNAGRPTPAATASDTIHLYSGTTVVSTGVATPRGTDAAFLLFKFTLDGGAGNDTLSLWVNPTISAGESGLGAPAATWTTSNLDAINGFRFQAGSSGAFNIDEIRLGTTFADVTPLAVLSSTVTLVATDASAGEFGADQTLQFTATRTGGDLGSILTVPLIASGTATSDTDYSGFAGSVVIPAGQSSATLILTALADTVAEGPETVTLSLGTGAGFVAGTPSSATAIIADKPSQDYYFTAIADPAKRAPTDDADGDGLPNVIEYFLGSDPATTSGGGVLTVTTATPGTFTLHYLRALNRTDAVGTLQWSTDLATWRTSGQNDGTRTVTFSESVVSAPGANPETVETTATVTGAGETPRIFVRLVVQ